jgi:lipid-binding SYLF domain-containing protein
MKKRSMDMAQWVFTALVFVACLTFASGVFSARVCEAATAQEINTEVSDALGLFTKQVKGADEFLGAAKGVLVIPNIIKAGFGLGGEYGEGALLIGGKTVEYYSLAAGSIGFQIGVQKRNLILVFREEEALKKFRASSGWKMGVDGSAAFINVGAGKSLDTISSNDPIVAFLFGQKGLMANATIEGAKLTKLVR